MRNLPKKDFDSEKLKDLFKNSLDEYIKKLPSEEQSKLKRSKLIVQAKIMYEKEEGSTNTEEGKKSKVRFNYSQTIGIRIYRDGKV